MREYTFAQSEILIAQYSNLVIGREIEGFRITDLRRETSSANLFWVRAVCDIGNGTKIFNDIETVTERLNLPSVDTFLNSQG